MTPLSACLPQWRALLPQGAVLAALEALGLDGPDAPAPHPLEQASLGAAQPVRQREFAAGRQVAHRALAALGGPAAPILKAPGGAPGFPPGTVGSISHCATAGGLLAVAAVAFDRRVSALGIDVEALPPSPATWPVFLSPAELKAVGRLPVPQRQAWACRAWSIKEALYKALGGQVAADDLAVPIGEGEPARTIHVAGRPLLVHDVHAQGLTFAVAYALA